MASGPHRAAMPRASAPAGRHLGKRADEGPGQKAASCVGPQWRKWQQQTTTGRPTAIRRARTARLALQNGPGRAAKRHTGVAVVHAASPWGPGRQTSKAQQAARGWRDACCALRIASYGAGPGSARLRPLGALGWAGGRLGLEQRAVFPAVGQYALGLH